MTASHVVAEEPRRTRRALIATGVWSIASVAVAATWAIGMPYLFPLLDDDGVPRLGPATVTLLGGIVVALSVLAAGAVFSGFGLRSRQRPRPVALAGLAAGLIAAVVQVSTLPLGLIGIATTGRLGAPLVLLWQVVTAVAVLGFVRLIRIEARRVRGRCLHCGGRHRSPARPVLDRPDPVMASAAVCVVSALGLIAVFPWAVVKLGWGLGGTLLGVTGEEWHRAGELTGMSPPARWLADAGLDITVLAAGVGMIIAVLLLARLPRWLPPAVLVVPAALAAIPLIGYGSSLLVGGLLGLAGVIDLPTDPAVPGLDLPLMVTFGGLTFGGIGTALAVGALSLVRRTRPVCRPGTYDPATRVAVIGGGFAGLAAVKELAKSGTDVTLIDQRTYATFQPLLYQVATGGLNAGDITYPIRNALAGRSSVRFVCDRVVEIDHDATMITTAGGERIGYDYVIVAGGAVANDFGIPGVAEHAIGIYTRPDALTVRDRLFGILEDAARVGDGTARSVVIVGGGATGIELAGNLAELRDHGLARSYPELDREQVKIILLEAGPRLLGPFAPGLQDYTLAQLRRRGVDVRLNTPIVEVGPEAVRLADGGELEAALVVWTAGVRGAAEPTWGLDRNRAGRVLLDRDLRVPGRPEVFGAGDAAVIQSYPLPQLAQPALQTGKHAARQILRLERDQPLRPFRYFDKGIMATIGEGSAVVELPVGPKITGPFAWLIWLAIHIVYLLGGRNRLVTAANLAVRYLRPGSFGVIVGDPVRATPAAAAPQPQSAVR